MSVADLFVGIVILFAIALFLMISITIYNEINDNMFANMEQTPEQVTIQNNSQTAVNSLDTGFVLIFGSVHLAAILFAFMVRVHPAFFIMSILIELMLIFFSGIIADVYTDFAVNAGLSGANSLEYTFKVFEFLPYISIGMATLIAVVMHGKTSY